MATDATQTEEAGKEKNWIDYIQKDLPEHLDWWPYTLGAIPLTLLGILVVTGLLLTFYYVPSPGKAYESVEYITRDVYLGWFVRGLHKFSVDLMILRSEERRVGKESRYRKWMCKSVNKK